MTSFVPRRFTTLCVAAFAGLALAVSPFSSSTASAQSGFEQEWQQLIAAAQKEGELVIASGGGPSRQYRPILNIFQEKFGIRVSMTTGGANDVANRVLAERQHGRSPTDMSLISIRINNLRFDPAGALTPIPPLLIHPDVKDVSNWHGNRHWYGDKDQSKVFIYHASVEDAYFAWYNTNRVTEEEIATLKSQQDFFHPRWQGRLLGQAMNDPSGVRAMMDAWNEPDRGPEWVRKYLTDAGVTFSPDRRVLENWLVGGRFHLQPVSSAAEELHELANKGLPIRQIALPRQTGTLRAGGSGCCLSVFEGATNPNAAKLFTNWFLSKEGQELTHTMIPNLDRASLRNDVVPGEVVPVQLRAPGRNYEFPDADPNSAELFRTTQAEVMKIWESRQR